MIALSNPEAQVVPVGSAVQLPLTVAKQGCCRECARPISGSVKLARKGNFHVHFHANISAAAATTASSLSLALGGEVIPYSEMVATSVAANDVNSVSITIPIHNCCCDFDRLTVINTGAQAVTVEANPLLYIWEGCE